MIFTYSDNLSKMFFFFKKTKNTHKSNTTHTISFPQKIRPVKSFVKRGAFSRKARSACQQYKIHLAAGSSSQIKLSIIQRQEEETGKAAQLNYVGDLAVFN